MQSAVEPKRLESELGTPSSSLTVTTARALELMAAPTMRLKSSVTPSAVRVEPKNRTISGSKPTVATACCSTDVVRAKLPALTERAIYNPSVAWKAAFVVYLTSASASISTECSSMANTLF